jgi:hypothetical protein
LRTIPLRIHRVHTRIRWTPPLITARTFWRLGFHRRLVLLLAWLTLVPNDGFFPHMWQCRIQFSVSIRPWRKMQGASAIG